MSAQKRNIEKLIRQTRALAIVAQELTPDIRDRIDQDLASIGDLGSTAVKALHEFYDGILRALIQKHDPVQPLECYEKFVTEVASIEENLILLPKYYIDKYLLRKLGDGKQLWRLSPHARIGINCRVDIADMGRTIEWRLLEAGLFE